MDVILNHYPIAQIGTFDIAPILVPHGDFDLAWLVQEELYAVH